MEPEDWSRLSSPERVGYCRRMASEADLQSRTAEGEAKQHFVRLALAWKELADEIEISGGMKAH